jgi:hypothetical protein
VFRLVVVLLSCVVICLASTAVASAATPKFVSATPTFTNPNLVVAFKERNLGSRHKVTYELDGMRRNVYECADGSNSVVIIGPILDQSTGFPFGSTPPTKTYTSTRTGKVIGSLQAEPQPAYNGLTAITCQNGAAPVMTADQYFSNTGVSDPKEQLSVVDTTHSIRIGIPGVYGFCNASPAYGCTP